MKHFFQFSFVIVVLFFLTSCRSMQWTSRRYTPGIFIDHASKIQRTEKSHFNELSSTGFSNAQQFETASIQLTPKLSVKEFSASADYSTASITNFNHSTYSNKEITTRIANSKMLKLNDTKASNQDFLDNRKVSSKSFGLLKNTNPLDEEGMFILLVILALLVPPLAVYIKTSSTGKWFWISLICCLFAGGIFFNVGFLGTAWIAAFIIALLVVLDILN